MPETPFSTALSTTSVAVTVPPCCQETPWRRLTVSVVLPSDHDVASCGMKVVRLLGLWMARGRSEKSSASEMNDELKKL